jgi:hypothetical protein
VTDHDPALVEKAARAIAGTDGETQDDLSEAARDACHRAARAVLDAVADDLLARGFDEGVKAENACEHGYFQPGARTWLRTGDPINPYRSQP